MRKLTFAMNLSLDGYIAAPGDDLGWSVPSDELFQWWSDRLAATTWRCTGANSGKRCAPWPTADPSLAPQRRRSSFARRWQDMSKVMWVFGFRHGQVGLGMAVARPRRA